jgi:flavin reductase (DIM6/NTAB) family NADH-FMN oxidoreductase RutF
MLLDLSTLSPGRAYRFLISTIVPRPIAFVSTVSSAGARNVAPFSYFMGVGSNPPTLALSILARQGRLKDTARNILNTGEFVVNIVTEEILGQVNAASGDYAASVDEFAVTGLTPVASERVRPPRVAESPVSLECRLYRALEIGEPPLDTRLIVGEVLVAHVRDDLWAEGMVRADGLRPVARLGANLYTTLGTILAFDRPSVDAEGRPVAKPAPPEAAPPEDDS